MHQSRSIQARGLSTGFQLVFLTTVLIWAGCGTARETTAPPQPTPDQQQEEADQRQPSADQPEAGRYLVSGYHPWWLQGAWREYDLSAYDEIYFFSVDVDSGGEIADRHGWPDRWFEMQREVSEAGVRVIPVVTLFSQKAYEELFSEPDASAALMESLVSLLRDSPGAGGLQLDFEVYQPVSPNVRSNFAAFVGRLREQMDSVRPGLTLSLYLLAYDQSDVFDEAALAEHADYVVVQGYDLHGRNEDRTGPVAGLEGWGDRNWGFIVRRFLDLGVAREKIVMGVPFYGYEWPTESAEPGARTRGAGRTIPYSRVDTTYLKESPPIAIELARAHGLQRDPESGSPYYAYEDSSGWRQGWFEDPESLEAKFSWIVEQRLRGVAVFPPAYGTEEMEALLRRYFQTDAP